MLPVEGPELVPDSEQPVIEAAAMSAVSVNAAIFFAFIFVCLLAISGRGRREAVAVVLCGFVPRTDFIIKSACKTARGIRLKGS